MNSLVKKETGSIVEKKGTFGANSVVESQEMTKTMAEVQSRVIVAKQFPRDITQVEAKLQASCERKSLAAVAEYEYPRGGQKVTGASIKLLEVVAQCYGNIQSGWDCVHRDMENHISHCKAFAWDVENNNYTEMKFDVPHIREKKQGNEVLTNPRDIYELEGNQASRRVRKCLETVIPRDLVEQAREWCDQTLQTQFDFKAGIDQALAWLKETYNVTQSQVEKYFGFTRQGFNKNTYLSLRKIASALKDGVSTVEDYFPREVEEKQTLIDKNELTKEVAKEVVKQSKSKEEPKQEEQQQFDLFGAFN